MEHSACPPYRCLLRLKVSCQLGLSRLSCRGSGCSIGLELHNLFHAFLQGGTVQSEGTRVKDIEYWPHNVVQVCGIAGTLLCEGALAQLAAHAGCFPWQFWRHQAQCCTETSVSTHQRSLCSKREQEAAHLRRRLADLRVGISFCSSCLLCSSSSHLFCRLVIRSWSSLMSATRRSFSSLTRPISAADARALRVW